MKLVLDKNQEKNIQFGPNSKLEVVLFEESNVNQKKGDNTQSKSNSNFCININDIEFFAFSWFVHNTNFLSSNAITRETIPRMKLNVNVARFISRGFLEAIGTITAAPNHPADKLTNKSEIVISQTGSILPSLVNLAEGQSRVN